MEVFGSRWQDYTARLKTAWERLVTDDDTVVIPGDISWAMGINEAEKDFAFLHSLPGKKIILKGNHDYWWNTASKTKKFFAENGISTIEILNNNCFFWEDVAICGTRGWFYEEEKNGEHDAKIMRREIMRLETSLKAAGDRKKLVFLHYPPIFLSYRCAEIIELLKQYEVRLCCYGHIHGKGCSVAFNGWSGGTEYKLVSADHVNFEPVKLLDRI
jgi:predicted phosphohydrolase